MFSPEWLGQALASQANPGYSDALDQGIWYDPPFMGSSREIFSGENFQQAARTYLCHLCRLLEDIFRVSFFFFGFHHSPIFTEQDLLYATAYPAELHRQWFHTWSRAGRDMCARC
jgi:hypothetical protein